MNTQDPIVFDKTHCLKMRHKASSCKACQEVCHNHAISWQDDQLTLHLSKCTQCGACVSACPQGSFASASQSNTEKRLAQESLSTSTLTIACSEAKSCTSNVQILCHHQLHPTLFLELAQQGVQELLLLTGQCRNCPKTANHSLTQLVDETLTIVADLGVSLQIKLCECSATGDLGKRALFSHFLHKADALVDRCYQADINTWFNPAHPHPPYVSKLKLRFYQALQKWATQATALPPTPLRYLQTPKIDAEHCTACNLCAWICPTGALESLPPNTIALKNSLCTGCHLCEDACFAKAIRVVPITLQTYLNPQRITLHTRSDNKNQEENWENKLGSMLGDVPIYRT